MTDFAPPAEHAARYAAALAALTDLPAAFWEVTLAEPAHELDFGVASTAEVPDAPFVRTVRRIATKKGRPMFVTFNGPVRLTIETPGEAWELFAARGLVPADWADGRAVRLFRCPLCKGSGSEDLADQYFEPCNAGCEGTGRVDAPWSIADAVAFAALDPGAVLAAEQIVLEIARGLPDPLGLALPYEVRWVAGEPPARWRALAAARLTALHAWTETQSPTSRPHLDALRELGVLFKTVEHHAAYLYFPVR